MREDARPTRRRCPKCGAPLYELAGTEWTFGGRRTVELACVRCLHTERVEAERGEG